VTGIMIGRLARYVALPVVSHGIIGGAAIGLAGMANAGTPPPIPQRLSRAARRERAPGTRRPGEAARRAGPEGPCAGRILHARAGHARAGLSGTRLLIAALHHHNEALPTPCGEGLAVRGAQ
jgi:hypothetical protein